MIIIDKPYISEFLKETLLDYQLPVLNTETAAEMLGEGNFNYVQPAEVIDSFRKAAPRPIYTPSENALHWISENLKTSGLPEKIHFFKDKVAFRKLIRDMYPGFRFREIPFSQLDKTEPSELFFPMILKPSVGFFSMGVRKVNAPDQWPEVVQAIKEEIGQLKNLYPNAVLDASSFIAEEIIEGEEYAVDAYFDEEGNPVLLGMMKHIFGSDEDVSDRVYFTSGEIIQQKHDLFIDFIAKLGELTGLKNFPLHVEVRIDESGKIVPIEVNPLRFGGWCTSADLMNKAYGINPYLSFCKQHKPDWKSLSAKNPGKVYSIVILDRHSGLNGLKMKGFDFEKLLGKFENPLEIRKVDFKKYPQFGFLFTETRKENFEELENILKSDLKEFLIL